MGTKIKKLILNVRELTYIENAKVNDIRTNQTVMSDQNVLLVSNEP